VHLCHRLLGFAFLGLSSAWPLTAQGTDGLPRLLSVGETRCESLQDVATDSVYEADAVDEPVQARRLPIEDMPFRAGEVLNGRSTFRFIVEPSGKIDRCSIELLQETTPAWTAAVLKELLHARHQPARRGKQQVRQRVYQLFTYHQDGRLLHGR
jgi:hypothetical protein